MAQNNGIQVTRICHLTSVHTRSDTRIFLKMCRSLANAGHDVSLVVADGFGDEEREHIRILDTGSARGRLDRMVGSTRRVLARALELDAEIYHLHDPELLPTARRLKSHGKKVVFDAHEDLPRQILDKSYLPSALRTAISGAVGNYLYRASRKLDAVIAATPKIEYEFEKQGIAAVCICNFPMLNEFRLSSNNVRPMRICYVGGITRSRGIAEMVSAMGRIGSKCRLVLGGRFLEAGLRDDVSLLAGWAAVDERGFLDRAGVADLFEECLVGLVTLHPTPAYLDALPVKMFEYMSAGLPVIASNFPLWREIVEGNECGICVDPLDPLAIAAAIDTIAGNPELARHMGEKGRRAVEQRYNWAVEEKKLLDLYDRLLVPRTDAA